MSYPIGETKVILLKCPAGATDSQYLLQPPQGFEWILYFLLAWHFEVDDKIAQWWLYSEEREYAIQLGSNKTISTAERYFFTPYPVENSFNFGLAMRFTHDCFPYVSIGGISADKEITIEGMILERPANIELSILEWQEKATGTRLPEGLQALKSRIEYYRGGIT